MLCRSVPKGLFWDTADPFHYVRLQREDDHDVLIVGGEDHKTGQEESEDGEARFARLESWARRYFPAAGEVEYRWSGQVVETIDGLAYIGKNSSSEPHIYIATGDCGDGMTHGTIAGMLLTDLIMGRPNAWSQLYDPARIHLSAAGEFLKENLNVAAQYGDYVTPSDVNSPDKIAPGAGAVIREGLKKLAIYRDQDGTLHKHSAVCTHLGCLVAWNDTEKSWDCPCHGSRFDPLGKVIAGPALTPLAEEE